MGAIPIVASNWSVSLREMSRRDTKPLHAGSHACDRSPEGRDSRRRLRLQFLLSVLLFLIRPGAETLVLHRSLLRGRLIDLPRTNFCAMVLLSGEWRNGIRAPLKMVSRKGCGSDSHLAHKNSVRNRRIKVIITLWSKKFCSLR